jgi:DNA topoisomerase-1
MKKKFSALPPCMKRAPIRRCPKKGKRASQPQGGAQIEILAFDKQQHFTQPPQRYTEASLVRALEDKGNGRPSTYAPTISTIISRGYIKRQSRTLFPTSLEPW